MAAKPWWVPLTPLEVEEFIGADKLVPGSRPVAWTCSASQHLTWRGGVEVAGQRVGEVFLRATPALGRHFGFKLSYRGEEIYRMDVRPKLARHKNTGCPERFDRKVTKPEHEHLWVEGLDCHCAHPLEGFESSGDIEIVGEFCRRLRIAFEPAYHSPFLHTQVPLL